MKTEIKLVRGQGADNRTRPHCDAGGFAKREHAEIDIPGAAPLMSPSWWLGCRRDQRAARATVAAAADIAAIRAAGWK